MRPLDRILAGYAPIALHEMDGVELMDRDDTKFLLNADTMLNILAEVQSEYRVLEVGGCRCATYETVYYDTQDFFFYLRHHNGQTNRMKIRKRRYVESNLNFLEVKFKTNREKTIKERTPLDEINDELSFSERSFIGSESHFEESLEAKVWNFFSRVSLVSTVLNERITVDFGLSFRNAEGRRIGLGDLVVVEIKQPRRDRQSPMFAALHQRHIRPESVSKYCIGAALLFPQLKQNSFKGKLRRVERIANNHTTAVPNQNLTETSQ